MKALLIHLIEVGKYVSNVTLHGLRLKSAALIQDWMFFIYPHIACLIA